MLNKAMFTSNSAEWETPDDLFSRIDDEFSFETDVCATGDNAKICEFISFDSLSQRWTGICWMNPPYGREIEKWIKKAYEESMRGATVVCLLPARTDTKWFHQYCLNSYEIRFIKGRIKFVGAKSSAPFPSMIVVFKNSTAINTPIISTMDAVYRDYTS